MGQGLRWYRNRPHSAQSATQARALGLLSKARSGDRGAEAELLRLFRGAAESAARGWGRHLADQYGDLEAEAWVGVWHALRRYDLIMGSSMLTWVMQAGRASARRYAMFAMGRGVGAIGGCIGSRVFSRHLRSDVGDSSAQQVADELGIPVERVVAHIVRWQSVSLDAPGGSSHHTAQPLVDTLPSHCDTPEEAYERAETQQALDRAMAALTWREQDVIARRQREETLSDIGRVYDLSRERIRQIEAVAIDKLRRALAA